MSGDGASRRCRFPSRSSMMPVTEILRGLTLICKMDRSCQLINITRIYARFQGIRGSIASGSIYRESNSRGAFQGRLRSLTF